MPFSDKFSRQIKTFMAFQKLVHLAVSSEVCVQTLAVMQLCFSAGPGSELFKALPRKTLWTMARLVPMVSYLLRPRRDDPVAQRYELGPLRLEAFVRRPDEDMQLEVYKAKTSKTKCLEEIRREEKTNLS